MTDVRKVIKGLKSCLSTKTNPCDGCSYSDVAADRCVQQLRKEALELLKMKKDYCERNDNNGNKEM